MCMAQIVTDCEIRKQREMHLRMPNLLRAMPSKFFNIDDLNLEEEGGGICLAHQK